VAATAWFLKRAPRFRLADRSSSMRTLVLVSEGAIRDATNHIGKSGALFDSV